MLRRIQDSAETDRWAPALLGLAVAGSVALGVSMATRTGLLEPATGLVALLALAALSLRWPLLPLFVLAALIPVEDAVNFAGVGTLGKVVGILFAVVYGLPRLGHLTLRAMPLAGWAYLAWAVLSLFWAVDPNESQARLLTLVQLFVVGVLVADVVTHDPTLVRPLLWVYSLSAALTATIGIAGYASGLTAGGARVAALAGQDPAQFAAILLPAFVFCLHELVNGRRMLASGVVAMLCTVAIVLSGTRGAWVSAVVVVPIFLIPQLRPRHRVLAAAASIAFVLVALQIPGVPDLISQRTALATATGGAGRTDIWLVGLKMFESAPVTGVGYGNFPVAFTPNLVALADADFQGYWRGPHSIIVGTLGELGLIGLICLALFLGPLILRRGWGPDGAVVQAILASIMISALFLDVLSNRKQVWLVIGLAAGLAYLSRWAKSDRGEPRSPRPPAGAQTTTPREHPADDRCPVADERVSVEGDQIGGMPFRTQAQALARPRGGANQSPLS